MKNRATKSMYSKLFDHPDLLFGSVKVFLWPNGQPEIWLMGTGDLGVRIRSSQGKAGFGLLIERFSFGPSLTVFGSKNQNIEETGWIEIGQYPQNEYSQKFKQWYLGKGPHP